CSTDLTMNTLRTMGALSLATVSLLFACDRTDKTNAGGEQASQGDKSGVTNVQGTIDTAIVDQLAAAECDREESCSKVGTGRAYSTVQVCLDQMHATLASVLDSYNCPRGIDRRQVEHCMGAIENEGCDRPLDALQRIDRCRIDLLCAK
ncbi:MAG TPA: DUF6184 family natural product biosynthesis lipoprotein, partial [Polyangiaceae bacterium]